jgi:hypothetical protein
MKELCDTCTKAKGSGCPIWPTLRITLECVEYNKKKK